MVSREHIIENPLSGEQITIRRTAERLPVTETTAASAFSAQIRASALASAVPTPAPTLPVAGSTPSTNGSCPAV